MARIQSLSILLEQTGNDFLSELYGKVIENVEKGLISGPMKNRDLSGDPQSGTVEAKRFVNASAKAYGTARAAGKGDNIKARPVPVPIDTDREIVEELENKDIMYYEITYNGDKDELYLDAYKKWENRVTHNVLTDPGSPMAV